MGLIALRIASLPAALCLPVLSRLGSLSKAGGPPSAGVALIASPTWRAASTIRRTVPAIHTLASAAIILIGALPALGQKPESDLQNLGLIGRVRQIKESVEAPRLRGDGVTRADMVYKFNRDGMLDDYISYSDGQPEGHVVYSYNPDGSRLEKIAHVTGETPTFRQEIKTDAEGKKVQVSESCGDGFLFLLEKYRYQQGDAVEISHYDHYGKLLGVRHLKYESGRLVEITLPNNYVEVHTYYDGGQPRATRLYTGKHELLREDAFTYKFDKFGNWIERHTRRRYSEDGKSAESDLTDYRAITYYPAEPDSAANGETTGVTPGSGSLPGIEQLPPAAIRTSGRVLQGSALRRVEPGYPSAAKNNHITGQVIVEITVDECGRVISSHALSGPAELRGAAADAARGWLFSQTKLDRIPVKVIGTITFSFMM